MFWTQVLNLWLYFHSLMSVFGEQKFKNLMMSNLSIYSFMDFCFGHVSKKVSLGVT